MLWFMPSKRYETLLWLNNTKDIYISIYLNNRYKTAIYKYLEFWFNHYNKF